jgi:diaminohydroxyphosphoribosylaminopyrimidine deaminase/5-amino-6-(5-phosphoribosylamino)uracil reductase
MRDPHEVAAGGVEQLRDAGIEVMTGVLESDARQLNEVFVHAVTHHRPFVVLKAGMTLDGKLATITRESKWITSEAARQKSLEFREQYDAILTGAGTIRDDNPLLTRRLGLASTPWTRIILDRHRIAPPESHVLTDGGNTIHIIEDIDLDALLADLSKRGIDSLIVEGGSNVLSAFIHRGLWQKMIVFIAPMIVGGAEAPSIFSGKGVAKLAAAYHFRFDRMEMVGDDVMITAYR